MASRRRFVRDSGIAFRAMMLPGVLRARAGKVAPSDLIRVGLIGCNGMGFHDLRSILKIPAVECAALCDVDAAVLNRQADQLERETGSGRPEEEIRRIARAGTELPHGAVGEVELGRELVGAVQFAARLDRPQPAVVAEPHPLISRWRSSG